MPRLRSLAAANERADHAQAARTPLTHARRDVRGSFLWLPMGVPVWLERGARRCASIASPIATTGSRPARPAVTTAGHGGPHDGTPRLDTRYCVQ
jgi:hypothetical protein